jgi:N-acetylornithine carbamoyltransferase
MEERRPDEVDALLALAARVKRGEISGGLERKVLAMVFMDPSLRTRTSMETAMFLHGGHAIALEPGKGSWALETDLDAVMDGSTVEHIIEAARVLSRYADALAIRAFPKGSDWSVERQDLTLRHFARYSDKPVINMESTRRHPCQGFADAMTLREQLGETVGKRFVLQWAWHPKALPTAVPASAAMAAAHLGMEVVIARPEGYDLDPDDQGIIAAVAKQRGGSLTVTDQVDDVTAGAHAVYAKSWGALSCFGRPDEERAHRRRQGYRDALPAGPPQRGDRRRGARRTAERRDRAGGEQVACAAGDVAGDDGGVVGSRESLVGRGAPRLTRPLLGRRTERGVTELGTLSRLTTHD